MAEASTENLKAVPLDHLHRRFGGRMVGFSGYSLPVQYSKGIIAEHKFTRASAGLFDVSHMGPSFLVLNQKSGDAQLDHEAVAALIEPLVCGDIQSLKPGQIRYTLMLNAHGGVIDDLMIGRPADPAWAGTLYIVVNAGTKEHDWALIAAQAGDAARLNRADNSALIALQGPKAVDVLEEHVPGVAELGFMTFNSFAWQDTTLIIARSGYTGEDGFEILVAPNYADWLFTNLLGPTLDGDPRVELAGLGARNSLRLEAGLPLYGHDLNETVSPTEAALNFAVSKRRREAADFPGADRILKEYAGDLARVRVGLIVEGAPAREGAEILDASGTAIGAVTSGGFAPSLGKAIALGFVPPAFAAPGSKLQVSVRGRAQPAEVVPTPFVPHRYFRKAKS